jgi:methionyl-tRNA formyltransferase
MKHKIFFFGTPDIAVPSLEALHKNKNFEIIGVGVFPDKKVGRKQVLQKCAVKIKAEELPLAIFEIEKKSDLEDIYKNQKFETAVVIAFGMIFPKTILKDEKFLNVHFSLLPKFRGASPVQSAILKGTASSGISIQKMVEKLDSGDILWQKSFPILEQKTSEIFQNFSQITAEYLPEVLKSFCEEETTPLPQDEKKATFCKKFEKKDGEIFPKKEDAKTIWQKFLAFDIFPQIFIKTKKGAVKLTEISKYPLEKSVKLDCANNSEIYIIKAQIPGKKETLAIDIVRGNPDIFDGK